jgi:tetratricopeptide (TPR) repeat protein
MSSMRVNPPFCQCTFLLILLLGLPEIVTFADAAQASLTEAHKQALAIYHKTKDPSQALKVLETAGIKGVLEKRPARMTLKEYAHLLNDYGFYLSQSPDRYREAIPVLQRATEMDSDRSVAFLNLGDAYWKIMEEAPDCRTQDKLVKEALSAYEHYQRLAEERKVSAVLSPDIENLLAIRERGPIQHLLPVRGRCEYKLVLSKEDKVCTYMQNLMTRGVETYGRGYHTGKFTDPVFVAISWTDFPLGKYVRFDINNDGQLDLVIHQSTSGLKSVTFDRLFIFGQGQSSEAIKTDRDLYEKSIGMVEIGLQQGYDFKGLPPRTHDSGLLKGKQYYDGLGWAVLIRPFVFDGTSYLLIKQSNDSEADPSDLVVTKYKKGRVRNADAELMEDICYMG